MSPEQPSTKIGKSVGEKLRSARLAQHYTQSQLAAPDFSVSYISAIERGQIHPSLRALEILAARLGMTSTQLLPNKAQHDERAHATANLSEREEDEVEFDLLDIQIRIIQGDTQQAIQKLEQLAHKRLKPHYQLKQRYLLGWAYYKAMQYQESEYVLSEATHIARDANAHYLHQRILHVLALTYSAMRNYSQALLSHQRCLNQIEESVKPDPFFKAQVYMYMGQHLTRLDSLEQALEMFNHALLIINDISDPDQAQAIYADLSRYYTQNDQKDLAVLYGYKSLQANLLTGIQSLRGDLYYYYGRAITKGDPERARAFLDASMAEEYNQKDTLTYASLLTRYAEWFLRNENLSEAADYIQEAADVLVETGDTIVAADMLIVMGRIAYAQKQIAEGSKYFVSGLDMLDRLHSHEELANESVRYAQLLEETGQEREAFAHFRRAFQSQQQLGK